MSAENAKNTLKTHILKHSEVIFYLNNFLTIDLRRKTKVRPWITFKCLNVLLCDPQDQMTNRRKPHKSQVSVHKKKVCRQQGINNPETYTIGLCLSRTNTTIIISQLLLMEIQQDPA
jgi:hypothetical protein